jgi:hypothetical protein
MKTLSQPMKSNKHPLQGMMSLLLLHFNKYNLGFHLKTIISKYLGDGTLNIVFNKRQEAPRNPSDSKMRDKVQKKNHKREED